MNQQSLDSIIFGGAQPLSQRPVLTFSGTKIITQLGDGTAGGSFGGTIGGFQVTMANTVALTIFTVALPASTGAGGSFSYAIFATDGTDYQIRTASGTWSCVNKAATITKSAIIGTGATTVAASAGTLTATVDMTTTSPSSSFQVTATSSLTPTTMYIVYNVFNDSPQTVTLIGS